MGSGRRKRKEKTAAAKAKDDRQELIRRIDRSLDSQPVRLSHLKFACALESLFLCKRSVIL